MPTEEEIVVLERVTERIKDGLLEADGLRVSEDGQVEVVDVESAMDEMRILGATVDGVPISISVNVTP